MAAKVEKINFNVPADLKADVEALAQSYGQTLSSFLVKACERLVQVNAQRIQEHKARASEEINFGGL